MQMKREKRSKDKVHLEKM